MPRDRPDICESMYLGKLVILITVNYIFVRLLFQNKHKKKSKKMRCKIYPRGCINVLALLCRERCGLLPQTSNNTSVTIKLVATCHLHADLLQLFNITCSEPVVNKL